MEELKFNKYQTQLSPEIVTIERKGKGKGLLVDSGRLTNAISYEVV